MARSMSRREITLAAILLTVVVGWLWLRSDDPFEGGVAAQELEALANMPEAPTVRMDLLRPDEVAFDQAGRDLFKYGTRPLSAEELAALEAKRRAEEEARRRAAEAAEKRREEAQAARARTPPPAQRGPSLPRIDLKYLGYLGPKDDRIAVFEDGDAILVGRVGEVLKEQFRVVDIQYESVVMGYTRQDLADKTQTLDMKRR